MNRKGNKREGPVESWADMFQIILFLLFIQIILLFTIYTVLRMMSSLMLEGLLIGRDWHLIGAIFACNFFCSTNLDVGLLSFMVHRSMR